MLIETEHLVIEADEIRGVTFGPAFVNSARNLAVVVTRPHLLPVPDTEGREIVRKWKEWKAEQDRLMEEDYNRMREERCLDDVEVINAKR